MGIDAVSMCLYTWHLHKVLSLGMVELVCLGDVDHEKAELAKIHSRSVERST